MSEADEEGCMVDWESRQEATVYSNRIYIHSNCQWSLHLCRVSRVIKSLNRLPFRAS